MYGDSETVARYATSPIGRAQGITHVLGYDGELGSEHASVVKRRQKDTGATQEIWSLTDLLAMLLLKMNKHNRTTRQERRLRNRPVSTGRKLKSHDVPER